MSNVTIDNASAATIRTIISHNLGLIDREVSDDATFEALGADSLDGVTVAMAIEDAFCIEIGDDVITVTTTVGEAIAAVERLLAAKLKEDVDATA